MLLTLFFFLGGYVLQGVLLLAADGGVDQNPCYDAVLNVLFISVSLQLSDSLNVGTGKGVI